MPPHIRQRIMASRPQFEMMARERYGVTINSGPFGINSRDALRGAKYAEAHGAGEAYHKKVLAAYWTEAQAIDDRTVLKKLAGEAGLDPEAFAIGLSDPRYDEAVQADIDEASQIGLSGVPALIFAGRYLVSGAQPYDVLANVVDQIRDMSKA